MTAELFYVSSAANKTYHTIDWNRQSGLICYASAAGLRLYDVEECKVVGVSQKCHTQAVTCVRFVQSATEASQCAVLTCSSDKTACLWRVQYNQNRTIQNTFFPCAVLKGHEASVAVGDAVFLHVGEGIQVLTVTTGDDYTVRVWLTVFSSGETQCCWNYTLPGRSLIIDVRFVWIPNAAWPILACGGDDGKIQIMTTDEVTSYKHAATLPGHQDWIMTLDYIVDDEADILLASGAKDGVIRLWRISPKPQEDFQDTLRMKNISFSVLGKKETTEISCTLEAVLHGHEGLVAELHWVSLLTEDGGTCLRLLSCAKTEDRSVIVWEPERVSDDGGMWLEAARLGEVGGNREGYVCCKFSADGRRIVAESYQGGLHLWKWSDNAWKSEIIAGGHFSEVVDLDWDSGGRYLLTTSKDQTTRLHAPWNRLNKCTWHEIGRPQVHGYDMVCLASLGNHQFVSGAEEKVIRGFTAPSSFIWSLGGISGVNVESALESCCLGQSAVVPPLGLSNKAVMEKGDCGELQNGTTENEVSFCKPLFLSAPPAEDQLMQQTLWPETSKLYGHGNEILSLAASHDGSYLASSCRASNELDAEIILWNTATWQQIDVLPFHRLSVTQMAFSPDDQYLLAVSRDRTWSLFSKNSDDQSGCKYKITRYSDKTLGLHSRIIWSCDWFSDSKHFVTASRDKTVVVWGYGSSGSNGWNRRATLKEKDEVTAVAVSRPFICGEEYVLIATGLVSGDIFIHKYELKNSQFSDSNSVGLCHSKAVCRLKFREQVAENEDIILASCGNDNSVHLYKILVHQR